MTLAIGCNLLYITSISFLCFVHTIHKEHTAGSRMPVQRHRETLFTHSSASVSMSSPSYKFARNTARNTAYSCIFIVQTSSQNGTVGTKDLSTCPITNEICPHFLHKDFVLLFKCCTSPLQQMPVWTNQTWQSSTNTTELILHKYGRKHRFQMRCLIDCVFLYVPFCGTQTEHKLKCYNNHRDNFLWGSNKTHITGNDLIRLN